MAWIRLFAVSHGLEIERAWDSLWTEALEQLNNLPETRAVTALALWPWFSQLLEGCGFLHENQVVMLSWEGQNPQVEQIARGLLIRPMNFDDIDDVHSVDLAAFNPIWQNSRSSSGACFPPGSVRNGGGNGRAGDWLPNQHCHSSWWASGSLGSIPYTPRQKASGQGCSSTY